jgi:hypothetical protein
MTFALVGRRIDPPDAERIRFPLRNREIVRTRLLALFDTPLAGTLVCSAGCGADLLALDAARQCKWRRRVILPFDGVRFRETSVTDRPGDWGELYDRTLQEISRIGDVVTESAPPDREPYAFANDRILEEALRIAAIEGKEPAAVVVWDGEDYGSGDLSASFAAVARSKGIDVVQVSTLE